MSQQGQNKIAQMVTDEIVAALDRGVVPWQQGWTARGWLPTSMSTGKPYRGSNPWVLNIKAAVKGYTSPYWGTYKRIAELGGTVRKGEKSTTVVFSKRIVKDDDTAPNGKRTFYLLQFYRVFNADQADGLPEKYYPREDERSEDERCTAADAIIAGYLDNGGPMFVETPMLDAPFYAPALDVINVPLPGQFLTMMDRYSTTFHELGHSTGHKSRLNRPGIAEFNGHDKAKYSREELVAALTSSMLLAVAGLDANIESNAAYIKHWKSALEDDPSLIIQAAGQAWKAVDHIQGVTYDNESE